MGVFQGVCRALKETGLHDYAARGTVFDSILGKALGRRFRRAFPVRIEVSESTTAG